ncbi:CinA family protein [Neomicrococcus lactis]|uniref:Nicotinamide-nucleotide amidase n=1 Tax=Neomicrococcus lactis TaxID=732241 RepID=A0A7W9DBE7_9MICC|nr:CinA family protein [Neomicrococcus lactis]MBB5598026.1 nicotinamide-nucleotide amidase [Neomicrococcus lactis]
MTTAQPTDAAPEVPRADQFSATELAADVVSCGVVLKKTVATAESLTAGLVAATIADIPGASAVLRGGVVSYDNAVKADLLGVSTDLLAERGSVDPQVAEEMAAGARDKCGADFGISTTGVAGPDAHDGKSVGTVYIGWADASGSGSVEQHFSGDRASIRRQSRDAALTVLRERMKSGSLLANS